MKFTLRFVLGILLLLASVPVFAETDGRRLFRQISIELAQYEAAHQLPDLMARLQTTVASAQMRSIEHHEYTITRYPDLFHDVSGLEEGEHPYHATGDWDCDGKPDQAVILQQPKAQIVVVLSSGRTLLHESDVDAISPGAPGRHLTARGKGVGDGDGADGGDATFEAKCGFIEAEYWGKSSFALVVDPDAGRLVEVQVSD